MKLKPWRLVGLDTNGRARILAGKMTHPDSMSWHLGCGDEILLTGLWRGNPRYGECRTTRTELLAALAGIGAQRDIDEITDCLRRIEAKQI